MPLYFCLCVFSVSLCLFLSLFHLASHIHPLFITLYSKAIYMFCPFPLILFFTCPHFSSLALLSLLLLSITLSPLRTLSYANSTHLAYLQNDPLLSFPAVEWLTASSNYLNAQQTAEKKCVQWEAHNGCLISCTGSLVTENALALISY